MIAPNTIVKRVKKDGTYISTLTGVRAEKLALKLKRKILSSIIDIIKKRDKLKKSNETHYLPIDINRPEILVMGRKEIINGLSLFLDGSLVVELMMDNSSFIFDMEEPVALENLIKIIKAIN